MRWWMLLILSLGFVELTLNWLDISAAFPALSQQFHLQIPQIALLISLFLAGYGLFHIPTGFLAYRFGLRNTLLAGLLLESLGGIATAFAPSYGYLEVWRFISGIGGSIFIGCGLSLVTSWFRRRELALAIAVSGGAAFGLGAVLGLYAWIDIIQATSWSTAILLGGVSGLVVFLLALLFLRVPNDERARLVAQQISWNAVSRVLGNRDLWFLGLGFLGVYGAGGTLVQLLSTYVVIVYHVPLATGGLMAAVLIIIGIPGSLVGGYLADHTSRLKPIIIATWLLLGLGLIIFPFMSLSGAWIVVIVLGAIQLAGFAAWAAAPGHYKDRISPEDVATAVGLMLTLAAVGGFLVPIGFGQIEASSGFTLAWVILGAASIIIALVAFAAREPLHVSAGVAMRQSEDTAL